MPNDSFIADVIKSAAAIQKKHSLPAAAITAQACLETGYGKHVCQDINTGQYSYNLFNIKGVGTAGSVLINTTEYYDGKTPTKVQDKFRAYNSYEESFEDYVKLISKPRYAPCRAAANDPDEYARQLQKCGYATDPNYPSKLIKIMDTYNLRDKAKAALAQVEEPPQVKIRVKGADITSGYLIENVSYAPVRALIEALQKTLSWNADLNVVLIPPVTIDVPAGAAGTVRIITGSTIIPGKLINSRSYAPVRQLAEALGHKVSWDSDNYTVIVE